MKANRILAAAAAVFLLTGCGSQKISSVSTVSEGTSEKSVPETVYVEMEVENYGTITLELDGRSAPLTVANFTELVNSGFYDGLTFHRIIDGFMIQGGDPTGTGYGGTTKKIKGEFAQNGYDNPISHTEGTISMARTSESMDSASSQFFICLSDVSYLDGAYAAFGHVTDGMDVVKKIASDARPLDDNGTIDAADQPVIKSAKVIEKPGD